MTKRVGSQDGIARLVQVSELKAEQASENLQNVADKQNQLIKDKRSLRETQSKTASQDASQSPTSKSTGSHGDALKKLAQISDLQAKEASDRLSDLANQQAEKLKEKRSLREAQSKMNSASESKRMMDLEADVSRSGLETQLQTGQKQFQKLEKRFATIRDSLNEVERSLENPSKFDRVQMQSVSDIVAELDGSISRIRAKCEDFLSFFPKKKD